MTRYTPGPWTTHKHLNGKLVIASHNDGSPALALAYIPTDIGRADDERAANAQLMAAAPE